MLPACQFGKTAYKTSEWSRARRTSRMRYEPSDLRGIRDIIIHGRLRYASWLRPLQDEPAKKRDPFDRLADEVSDLSTLRHDWDEEGSAPPTAEVISLVKSAIDKLEALSIRPTAVRPSSDGGAGICFAGSEGYGHIELLNDGTIHCVAYSKSKDPEVWTMDNLKDDQLLEAWNRIRAHL